LIIKTNKNNFCFNNKINNPYLLLYIFIIKIFILNKQINII
jgi:hypothetical protein